MLSDVLVSVCPGEYSHIITLGERLPGQRELFATRWNAAHNRRARDRLLSLLRAHQRAAPGQRRVRAVDRLLGHA